MAKEKNQKHETTPKKYTLVIVESPAKAKTINKYLGSEYKVTASMGHIIDLPKSRIGIDIDNNFKPEYITVRGKGKILTDLKKFAANAKTVLLASDNDREGEAIAFHIYDALNKRFPELPIKRIVFNEITKNAIIASVKAPQNIDVAKVEAQEARRILDRLIGYKISPILWVKVKNGLSAGRVQSVALKAICQREEEIQNFIPQEYWTFNAIFEKEKKELAAELIKINDEKPTIRNNEEVENIKKELEQGNFIVTDINKSTKALNPQPPFITSKLQQVAANRLNFSSKKTMSIAQQLYEGIDIGRETVGLITYMRTDSTRISEVGLAEAREYISKNFPPEYLPESPVLYTKKTGAQDAHEAIRPTSVNRTPESMKKYLNAEQFKLYSIIWERFVASQMKPAEYLSESINIQNGKYTFRITSSKMTFKGFNVCLDFLKSKEAKSIKIPALKENEELQKKDLIAEQHFTQPQPRFTDASIIKFLEENGIGRPSTYAPIISTLLDRYYVVKKAKQITPTQLGKLVNDIIVTSFSNIVNIDFTAKLENQLDEIANGKFNHQIMLHDFYEPFKLSLEEASKNLEDHKKVFDEETDEICDKCNSKMVKKLGKYGFFLACTNFPDCRNAKTIPLANCPVDGCNGKIIPRKKGPRGKEFYGCTNYPECDFVVWSKPLEQKCPKCGKFLIEKNDKVHGNYKVCVDEKNCGYKLLEEYSNE